MTPRWGILHCLQPLAPSSAELPLCVRWERLLQAPCSWVPWSAWLSWRLDRLRLSEIVPLRSFKSTGGLSGFVLDAAFLHRQSLYRARHCDGCDESGSTNGNRTNQHGNLSFSVLSLQRFGTPDDPMGFQPERRPVTAWQPQPPYYTDQRGSSMYFVLRKQCIS